MHVHEELRVDPIMNPGEVMHAHQAAANLVSCSLSQEHDRLARPRLESPRQAANYTSSCILASNKNKDMIELRAARNTHDLRLNPCGPLERNRRRVDRSVELNQRLRLGQEMLGISIDCLRERSG